MAAARRASIGLRRRPGVVGLALYGSLAGDPAELTPFSDVDMALILDRKCPPHFTEHRLVGKVKADLLLFHLDRLREIASRSAERLAASSWTEDLLIKGLLRGGPDTVLFDPAGEIARAKRELAGRTTWGEVARIRAVRVLKEAGRELKKAATHFNGRRWGRARFGARCALWEIDEAVLESAGTKRREVAARRLGLPRIARLIARARKEFSGGPAAARACWQADRAFWHWLLREFYPPIEAQLRREGVRDPGRLELAGDYPGFWRGNRIHEFGRLKAEVELSLRWSLHALKRGDACQALETLGYFADAWHQCERCRGIRTALRRRGHNVTATLRRIFRDPEFLRLMAAADKADGAAWRPRNSRTAARRVIRLVRRLLGATETAFSSA